MRSRSPSPAAPTHSCRPTSPIPSRPQGEVLVEVAATAVNRADLLQRQGFYDPPPGASPYPGLECSRPVAAVGARVERLGGRRRGVRAAVRRRLRREGRRPGRAAAAGAGRVSTCVDGRGAARGDLHGLVQRLHDRPAAAAARRCWCTAAPAASARWRSSSPRRVGARVAVTAGGARRSWTLPRARRRRPHRLPRAGLRRGAARATPTAPAPTSSSTSWARSTSPATSRPSPSDGRLVVIGLQGGTRAELDLGALLRKRAAVIATSLRARPAAEKAAIVAAVREHVWPLIERGRVRPVVDRTYRWRTPPTPTACWRPARTSARCCSLPERHQAGAPRELVTCGCRTHRSSSFGGSQAPASVRSVSAMPALADPSDAIGREPAGPMRC